MTTVPTIPQFTAGSKDVAANLQALADMLTLHENPPYCDVSSAAGITCLTATATLLTFDTENQDTDSMFSSGNPGRLLLNTAGLFEVNFYARWPSGMTGDLVLNLRLNSAESSSGGTSLYTLQEAPNGSGTSTLQYVINYRPTSPGTDYLEIFATQNSGSSKTTAGGQRVTGAQVKRISG